MDENQKRYEEILRKIANRDHSASSEKSESVLTDILNQLNVLDELTRISEQSYNNVICYRPKLFAGKDWCGILIWYHKKGYLGYQTLMIFGVWLVQTDAGISVQVGERTVRYKAAVFNPDSYYQLIRKGFYTYYQDRGQPPGQDAALFSVLYDIQKRIELRTTLKKLVRQQINNIASL